MVTVVRYSDQNRIPQRMPLGSVVIYFCGHDTVKVAAIV